MQIPLFKIYWDNNDIEQVTSVIKKGSYWALGPEIKEFEKQAAKYVGAKYALAVNSGTSALHTVLAAHGISKGDEVIVPSFTFIATANSVLMVGAKPVFADIEEETYGLDPEDVERKITTRTRAIMPVHCGGLSCHIKELKHIADKYKLLLIEDAAESLGATVSGQKVGSFGDSAILSFCSPKVITMGEGGMVFTNSRDVYEKSRLIYNHGRVETSDYFSSTEQMEYITLGYNFRMSTMTAALGISQIKKIDRIIQMRRENADYLTKKLSQIKEIRTPVEPNDFHHVYQMYTIRLNAGNGVRDRLKEYLNKNGIGTKIYFDPVHLSLFYRREMGYKGGELPVTENISRRVLTLPMFPALVKDEMDYIVEKIKDFFISNPIEPESKTAKISRA
jgi:perosamine synthetase